MKIAICNLLVFNSQLNLTWVFGGRIVVCGPNEWAECFVCVGFIVGNQLAIENWSTFGGVCKY